MTDIIKSELGAFENLFEGVLEELPDGLNMLLKMPGVKRQVFGLMDKIEDFVIPFMNEDTGLVDGVALQEAVQTAKPELADYIPFPDGDFRLVDVVGEAIETVVSVMRDLLGLFGGK